VAFIKFVNGGSQIICVFCLNDSGFRNQAASAALITVWP
jgi:hypothetical protein